MGEGATREHPEYLLSLLTVGTELVDRKGGEVRQSRGDIGKM